MRRISKPNLVKIVGVGGENMALLVGQTDLLYIFWQGEETCGRTSARCPVLPCGQTCLYQFVSSSEKTITARHTTPAARSAATNKLSTFIFNFKGLKENIPYHIIISHHNQTRKSPILITKLTAKKNLHN